MALADDTTAAGASAQASGQESIQANPQKPYSATPTLIWLIIVLLLLAFALLPPAINIGRYQQRIAQTISTSIGRPVHLSSVKLRLLPRPGFEISDFVVDEDPAFGAESMLRSASVVASIRLLSIWQGRLEIARIQLDEPSLNLVRRRDGQWNFGSVLLKASTTPNAPTAQRNVGSAPRFPYIEATNARINFKTGDEKKPFSFLNADLSVWLDNPDEWRLRFRAQPVRTDLDLDLADTGVLKINGSIKRAAALNEVPLLLHAEWTKAPLGQLSRMFAGRDAGWRGDLEVLADISGTGERAILKTQLRATNVHRIEFAPREPMDLDANCQATYTRGTHSLDDVACTSPVGNGHLLLHGQLVLRGSTGSTGASGSESIRATQPSTTLDLQMQKVPVSAALGLARSVREGFAPNLKATGSIDGGFQYSGEAAGAARLQGEATLSGLALTSPQLERPLLLPPLQFISAANPRAVADHTNLHKSHLKKRQAIAEAARLLQQNSETALLLLPVGLPAGSQLPLQVDGRFTRSGYQMHLAGSANVKSLVAYSRAFGLLGYTVSPLAPTGTAQLDLRTSGAWLTPITDPDHPTPETSTQGQLQLRNARIATDYLAAPLDVPSAHATFTGADVNWDAASVAYGQLHADGSLQYSQTCSLNCAATFNLRFETLDIGAAQSTLLSGGLIGGRAQFLDELLARLDHRAHPWPTLSGTLEATTLTLQKMSFHEARAALEIHGNQVVIQAFDGHTLGGTLHATGTLDASGVQPAYTLQAAFNKVNAAEIAALFQERWGEGQLSGTTKLQLSGYKPEDLAASARGAFRWDWIQGRLPMNISPEGETQSKTGDAVADSANFKRWSAEGTIAAGRLTLTNGTMVPAPAISASASSAAAGVWPRANPAASIRGTISFLRELNLEISDAPRETSSPSESGTGPHPQTVKETITGTLSQPRLQINAAVQPHDQAISQGSPQ